MLPCSSKQWPCLRSSPWHGLLFLPRSLNNVSKLDFPRTSRRQESRSVPLEPRVFTKLWRHGRLDAGVVPSFPPIFRFEYYTASRNWNTGKPVVGHMAERARNSFHRPQLCVLEIVGSPCMVVVVEGFQAVCPLNGACGCAGDHQSSWTVKITLAPEEGDAWVNDCSNPGQFALRVTWRVSAICKWQLQVVHWRTEMIVILFREVWIPTIQIVQFEHLSPMLDCKGYGSSFTGTTVAVLGRNDAKCTLSKQ